MSNVRGAPRELLRAIRDGRGLSLADVEQATGVRAYQISRIEQGQTAEPKWIDIIRLAAFYGLDLDGLALATDMRAVAQNMTRPQAKFKDIWLYVESNFDENEQEYLADMFAALIKAHKEGKRYLE